MSERAHLTPSASHPIVITPTGRRVTVHIDGELIADTFDAVTVREADFPEVQYIPLDDVVQGRLTPSRTITYCPYKGEANYYGVQTADGEVADAIWYYAQPFDAVRAIAGRVAFYPDRADIAIDGTVFDGSAPVCECQLDDQ